jgi:hypothetical protein
MMMYSAMAIPVTWDQSSMRTWMSLRLLVWWPRGSSLSSSLTWVPRGEARASPMMRLAPSCRATRQGVQTACLEARDHVADSSTIVTELRGLELSSCPQKTACLFRHTPHEGVNLCLPWTTAVLACQQAKAKPRWGSLRRDRAGPCRGGFMNNREDERVAYCSLEEWEA